ncbi:DNA-processing protein DprA [Almyronema epifaneia]|uniref:DNA-processing protein DprA n=1 Tax=Almyronema epifaneia S1 TaxID=2991925 RepID=A0ABW6IHZ1_9CYAN
MVDEKAYWLAWSGISGIGPVLLKRIYEQFGSLKTAWTAPSETLQQVEGIGRQLAETILKSRSQSEPEALLSQHLERGETFITPTDADYPSLLFEIADPPPVLYYRGQLQAAIAQLSGLPVGLVGTRSPSDYGKRWTRKLTQGLVQQGCVIISGLADGIDAVAHQQCLAQQGLTIAVLGTGVDVVYPLANRRLYEQIAAEGLLLSEYPLGTAPSRSHFPQRNRIIAGLSRAIIVTEAPQRSGALITARLANEYGRDVYVLPCSLDNSRGLGCLALINQGGQPILSVDMLLTQLGKMPPMPTAAPSKPLPELEPTLAQVMASVTDEPLALDKIVQKAGLATGAVLSALMQLELLELVSQLPGMHYQRRL